MVARSFLLLLALTLWSQPARTLAAHIDVTTGPPTWSYTLFNDEPVGSPNFLSSFQLDVTASIVVTGTPTGWDFLTDGSSFVFWFNTDTALPYPHDIAPGSSLGGFEIQSTATNSALDNFALTAWDHVADAPGPVEFGTVLVPSTAAVPEPTALSLFAAGGLLMLLVRLRRRQRKT